MRDERYACHKELYTQYVYYIFIYLFITPGAGTYIQYMYVATYCIHDILCIHTCAHVHHVCVHSIYAHNIII